MKVRFGIIGCGMIANFHAAALAQLRQAELAGVTSRSIDSANRFARKHDCPAYASIDELLARDEIDAISICSPSGAHLPPALAAAAAGKHVVVEKPLEITTARCDQIIEACQRHGVLLSTIFQSRFHQSSKLLKAAVEAGRFHKLCLGSAYVKWFRNQSYYDGDAWRGTWELDGGGALMNQAIHNVDLLQWIMGPVRDVFAFTDTLTHERIEVEDTAVASLRFASGALGTIEATTSAWPGSLKRLEIYGSAGSAIIEDEGICKWEFAESLAEDADLLQRFSRRNRTSGGSNDPTAIDISGHRSQFQEIVSAIQSGQPLLVDGREARKSVAIIEAIYESSQLGRPVTIQ